MDYIEYQKRKKSATGLLIIVPFSVFIVLEASLRLVAIAHKGTLDTVDLIAHSNRGELRLRTLEN